MITGSNKTPMQGRHAEEQYLDGRYRTLIIVQSVRPIVDTKTEVWPIRVRCGPDDADVQSSRLRVDPSRANSDGLVDVGRMVFLAFLDEDAIVDIRIDAPGSTIKHRFSGPLSFAGTHILSGGKYGEGQATIRIDVGDFGEPGIYRTEDGEAKGRLRRFAWIREMAGDKQGRISPDVWDLWETERRANRVSAESFLDPGPPPAAQPSWVTGTKGAAVGKCDDPLPDLTPYSVSRFVRVSGPERMPEAMLTIALKPEDIRDVDPASVRIFRLDERRQRMTLVHPSGLGADGTYVFAAATGPGVYGAYGLPRAQASRLLLELTSRIFASAPLLHVAGVSSREMVGNICQLIMCAPDAGLLADPARLAVLGVADIISNAALYFDSRLVPVAEETPAGIEAERVAWLPNDPTERPGGPPGERRTLDTCGECLQRETPGFDRPERLFDIPDFQLLEEIAAHGSPQSPPVWYSRGPFNIGGRIRSLAFDPTDGSVAWAAAAQGGVWKSLDSGKHWNPRSDFAETLSIGSIAVSPSNPDIVYAGTGEYPRLAVTTEYRGRGVLRTDNGWTFELMSPAPRNIDCSRIAVHPTEPDRVYIAGSMGIERWDAANNRWDLILTDSTSDIVLDPGNPRRLYAAVESLNGAGKGGVAVTQDAEAGTPQWAAMNSGLMAPSNLSWNFGKLAIAQSDADVIYLSINREKRDPTEWVRDGAGLYRWDAAQATWIDRGKQVDGTQGSWCNTVSVHPSDPDHVIVAGQAAKLHESLDGGVTWRTRKTGHADNHSIVFKPNDPAVTLVANDGGVWRHRLEAGEEETPYESSNGNLVTTQFFNVSASRSGERALGGSTQDQGIALRRGFADFVKLGGNEGGIFEIDPSDSSRIYWDPWNGDPRVSDSTASNGRRSAANGLEASASDDDRTVSMKTLAIHPTNSAHLICSTTNKGASGNYRVYRSTDGASLTAGGGWQAVVANANDVVRRIVFAPSDPQIVYFCNDAGEIWRSDDGGASFLLFNDLSFQNRVLAGLTVDWNDPSRLFLTVGGWGGNETTSRERAWTSVDSGMSWTSISGIRTATQLPRNLPFVAIAQDKQRPERLYAASLRGVLYTPNGGDDWYWMDEGLPNAPITDMDYVPDGTSGALYVSTIGRGFWRRTTEIARPRPDLLDWTRYAPPAEGPIRLRD